MISGIIVQPVAHYAKIVIQHPYFPMVNVKVVEKQQKVRDLEMVIGNRMLKPSLKIQYLSR